MPVAITREVSAGLAQCELTHLPRKAIDIDRARAQHALYEAALARLGLQVVRIAGHAGMPDCVFIEDTALVLDELALITRPGAPSRRAESHAVAAALHPYRPLTWMREPATLDGGDVLRIGKRLYVGRSSRTNAAGLAQLRDAVAPHGYAVEPVDVRGCLHLKSAVTEVADQVLLLNPAWVDAETFANVQTIEIDPREPHAANALRINDTVLYPAHFPHTARRLEHRGIPLEQVPCDELAKAEGAVTCCSLILQ